jgi:hypothetical protein
LVGQGASIKKKRKKMLRANRNHSESQSPDEAILFIFKNGSKGASLCSRDDPRRPPREQGLNAGTFMCIGKRSVPSAFQEMNSFMPTTKGWGGVVKQMTTYHFRGM